MDLLDAALLAELGTPTPAVSFVLELGPDGAPIATLSEDPVNSPSLGPALPWLTSWGSLSRRLSGWRSGVQASTLSVEVDDTGGQFTLAYGRKLRGTAARAKLAGHRLAASTFFTWFKGVVDNVSKSGSRITIDMRQEDDHLATQVPKATIRPNVFPNLPGDTDLRGQAIPYLIGEQNGSGLGAKGMIRCEYVGTPGAGSFRYLLSLGWWPSLLRVFSDGVEKASPLDFSALQALTGDSRRVTLVDFKVDQGSKEIIADVQDLVSPAGPAACLQQLLTDLAWNDYHATSFAAASAPINAAAVTALDAFLVTALGLTRSYYIPGKRKKAGDVIREFCASYDASAHWRYDGTLSLIAWEIRHQNDTVYLGPGSPDTSLAKRQVLCSDVYLSEPQFPVDPESTVVRITGRGGRRGSDEAYLNQRSVVTEVGEALERSREAEMPWLPATAESVGNLQTLVADGSSGAVDFTAVGAATLHEAVAQGPPPGSWNNSIYANSSTSATIGAGTASFDLTLTGMPDVVAVASVQAYITAGGFDASSADQDRLNISLVISGTPYASPLPVDGVSGVTRFYLGGFVNNPATGVPWTKADLDALVLRVTWVPSNGTGTVLTTKRVRVRQAYVQVSYTAAANVSPALLAILSRQANRYRTPPELMTVVAPLRFMDYELGDDVPLEDPREGWGRELWQRGRGRVVGLKLNPSAKNVELTLENVRDQLTTFWLLGRALASVDGTSAVGDGVALVTHGSTVTVARASLKCLDSPAGIDVQAAGPVVQVLNNCWPSDRYGTLAEQARTNRLLRSSFKSAGTGLTPSAGSGTITFDTTVGEQLFVDAAVAGNILVITAGSPHSTESRETWPVTAALTSGGKMVVSIDYRGSSLTANDGPAWRLVRTIDGWYWNDTTGAWQSGAVDNRLVESLSWKRSESKVIPIGTDATRTFTFSVSLPSGGTNGRTVKFGHVQIEEGEWRTSRIVTDAAVASRVEDTISFGNDKSDGVTTYYLMPNDRGTWVWRIVPQWSNVNAVGATHFTLFALSYNQGNSWLLRYVIADNTFRFKARNTSTDYEVSVPWTVVSGVELTIRARWTSSLGEWGKPLTLTLVVTDGTTKVSAEVAYVKPTFVAAKSLDFACNGATADRQLSGYVVEARVSPRCFSDEEMGL